MSASKIPPDQDLPELASGGDDGAAEQGAIVVPRNLAEPPTRPRMPPTIRAGMGDLATELVEIYSDGDLERATGLLSILGPDGRADRERIPEAAPEIWHAMYRGMLRIRLVDRRLMALAAVGRIAIYANARGQEAAVVVPLGTLAAGDWVVPSHREGGAALYRGQSMRSYISHAFGNANDVAKGRRQPAQPAGLRALNVLPPSATSATKLPQAAGLAWAAKIQNEKTVVLAYLAEGATAAEDFHTGMNFAAVFNVPVIFVCINAGGGVSTPSFPQSGSLTYAVKALAYGMPGIRVDGNDPFALHVAARAAVDRARRGGGPSFIEAVTDRALQPGVAHDEPDGRPGGEAARATSRDPLSRFSTWLSDSAILDQAQQRQMAAELEAEIEDAIALESAAGPPGIDTLIEDVYLEPPAALREQLADLKRIREASGPSSSDWSSVTAGDPAP